MNQEKESERHLAAQAARAYLEKAISWRECMDKIEGSQDSLISDLESLIEHEPKRGGFMGVGEHEWANYQTSVRELIAQLERGLPNQAL